jgi:hypothetical protein
MNLPKTPRAKLVKLLDIEWARIIKRDGKCAKCGETKNLHAAHIFSRVAKSVRWDLDNGIPLCFYHHLRWGHQNPMLFSKFATKYLGEEKMLALEQRQAQVKKWSLAEMECLLKLYQQH